MLFSDLCKKEVINVKDCRRIGHVVDLEFDEKNGCICKITVGGCSRLCSLFRAAPDCVICYKDICQIGPDIILVDICI